MERLSENLLNLVDIISRRHGVDPNLTYAVMNVESRFDPKAKSKKGAKGLMQLSPLIATAYGVTDPYDPIQSIETGVKFLSYLLSKYEGDERKALAHYVGGYRGVRRPSVVSKYVDKVLHIKQQQPFPLYPKEIRFVRR